MLALSCSFGIPEGDKQRDVLVQLIHEVDQYRAEIRALEEMSRQRSNRRNN
jgi:hypothetical protein